MARATRRAPFGADCKALSLRRGPYGADRLAERVACASCCESRCFLSSEFTIYCWSSILLLFCMSRVRYLDYITESVGVCELACVCVLIIFEPSIIRRLCDSLCLTGSRPRPNKAIPSSWVVHSQCYLAWAWQECKSSSTLVRWQFLVCFGFRGALRGLSLFKVF